MKQSSNTPLPRRHFLRQLLVLGGTTGAGAIAFTSARLGAAPRTTRRASSAASTAPTKGYRLTDHIRTYYEKAQKI